jgi:translocator protein
MDAPSNAYAPGKGWQLLSLAAWLALTFAAAALGAMGSADAADFYAQLERPDWAPPAALFGPVWTVLYAMMATAAWLVWREPGLADLPHRSGFSFYLAQLVLNALWPWYFFQAHRGDLAMADILLLCVLVLMNALAFWRVRRLAGLLLLPYLAWVGFAAALTYALWQMNPELLGRDGLRI